MKKPSSNHIDSVSTLRKHYAGLAMQALIPVLSFKDDRDGSVTTSNPKLVSAAAVDYADALIAELSKK